MDDCDCGLIDCSRCGPQQGFHKCEGCGAPVPESGKFNPEWLARDLKALRAAVRELYLSMGGRGTVGTHAAAHDAVEKLCADHGIEVAE